MTVTMMRIIQSKMYDVISRIEGTPILALGPDRVICSYDRICYKEETKRWAFKKHKKEGRLTGGINESLSKGRAFKLEMEMEMSRVKVPARARAGCCG